MGDLISRKEVEKAIKDYFKMIIDNTDDDIDCVLDYNKNLCDAIREIPTAYDVDKVIVNLMNSTYVDEEKCYFIPEETLAIVKRGGKDE